MFFLPLWLSSPPLICVSCVLVSPMSPNVISLCSPFPLCQFVFNPCDKHSGLLLVLVFLVLISSFGQNVLDLFACPFLPAYVLTFLQLKTLLFVELWTVSPVVCLSPLELWLPLFHMLHIQKKFSHGVLVDNYIHPSVNLATGLTEGWILLFILVFRYYFLLKLWQNNFTSGIILFFLILIHSEKNTHIFLNRKHCSPVYTRFNIQSSFCKILHKSAQ